MKFISAFQVSETILFKLLIHKYISDDVHRILQATPAFHTFSDVQHVYDKRWQLIKHNSGVLEELEGQYQIMNVRKRNKLIDYVATLVRHYPYESNRQAQLFDNLEASKSFKQPYHFYGKHYQSQIPMREMDAELLQQLKENEHLIGTNTPQWHELTSRIYLKHPNLLSHINLMCFIMMIMTSISNVDDVFVQRSNAPKWDSCDVFYGEKLASVIDDQYVKIMMKPYHDDLRDMLRNDTDIVQRLNALYSVFMKEHTWLKNLLDMDEFHLQDVASMMPNVNELYHSKIELKDLLLKQYTKEDWLLALKICSPSMNHYGAFFGDYLLPDSEYIQSVVALLYFNTLILWYQLNWTDEEYEKAKEKIMSGTNDALDNFNYTNNDGTSKSFEQILEEQTKLHNSGGQLWFGDRKNGIIPNMLNIGDELLWNMGRNQYNNIIL